ncbi:MULTISPECIES: DUF4062 domain-containing protein [unclassified Paraflavitalea]|uniref:DUF4062 domain-containing protein n=1 Tax=unclassified Paraflavitalea TaxID=2798305 RepID=UPI003D34F1D4
MKDKKLQVFVSSTFTDLIEERQAAVEAILSSGHIPAGMELFSAGDESQMTVIERWIDESDVYLLILGGRYGSVDNKTGKSYTQLEYEYAIKKNKPMFAVVISDNAINDKIKVLGRKALEEENPKLLKEFRLQVLNNLIKFWDDKKDIKIAIHEKLSEFSYRKDLVGWVKGDKMIDVVPFAEEIARLIKENSELRISLNNAQKDSNSTYASLTYNQLKNLLESETIVINDNEISLFNFMLANGKSLGEGLDVGDNSAGPFLILASYKVVLNIGKGFYRFRFTDDGHNFYLKSLAKSVEN